MLFRYLHWRPLNVILIYSCFLFMQVQSIILIIYKLVPPQFSLRSQQYLPKYTSNI